MSDDSELVFSLCTYRTLIVSPHHRVDRVLSFFSSRRNWDSPTPSPAGSGRRAHSLAREGLGESQFRRGDIHFGTIYIYVLCGLHKRPRSTKMIFTACFFHSLRTSWANLGQELGHEAWSTVEAVDLRGWERLAQRTAGGGPRLSPALLIQAWPIKYEKNKKSPQKL
jgi:hypothetical protein